MWHCSVLICVALCLVFVCVVVFRFGIFRFVSQCLFVCLCVAIGLIGFVVLLFA